MIFFHHSEIARIQHAALQKFGLRVIADVNDEPLSLADAHTHLRLDTTNDDAWLTTFGIPQARAYCENYLGRSMATRTLELTSNRFPIVSTHQWIGPYIELPFGPVQSVSSVSYVSPDPDSSGNYATEQFEDSNGLLCELDSYVTPNRLVLKFGQTWPSARDSVNSVKVRYVAGYLTASDSAGNSVLPPMARAAMTVMLGLLFENRDVAFSTDVVDALLDKVPGTERENLGMA